MLNICLLAFLCGWSLDVLSRSEYAALALGLGVVGFWRHGWGMLNFLRAIRFRNELSHCHRPLAHRHYNLSILLPVYSQPDDMLRAVAAGIVQSVRSVPGQVLIVCAYRTEDQRELLSEAIDAEPNITTQFVQQIGLGKREAMADALSLMQACFPAIEGNFTLLMDGDTVLTPEVVQRSIGEMQVDPNTGAVRVNEVPLVEGDEIFVD